MASSPRTGATAVVAGSSPSVAGLQADWWARGIGAGGLVLGIANLLHSVHRNRRERRLSIEDDFWFRKIVTPATIEPILQAFVRLLRDLPSPTCPEQVQREFAVRITTELQALYASSEILALYKDDLAAKVIACLQVCEDLLTEYSRQLADPDCPQSQSAATSVKGDVWSQLRQAMQLIKDQQLRH